MNVLLEEMGHYIDSQINIQDAPGDEGAIFAKLLQNQPLAPGELITLQAEDDHEILNIDGENIAVEHADTPGVFIVDNTGKISIDFLADSGSYHNEMAIFSLQNMDNLTPGSADYIKEAARRSLSNSTLGYTVIIDINEGAKFVGELGESNKNDGNYSGLKTFSFTPGDKVAFMLVPQGTVQQVFDNPNPGNSQRPLFSITAANPNNAIQIGQLVPGTFGWEDIRNDQGTDADYNDIIFKIKGASGTLTDIGGLFASGKDWRNLPLAQEIIKFASSTDVTAKLSQDTGISNLDGITNNPEIAGSINNADNLGKLQAKFSDGSNFIDILSEVKANGNFTLNKDKLAAIKGNQLADGEYQLTLRSEDKFGNVSESLVKFTLDTTKPGIPTEIGLKNDSDTVTNQNTPTITGKGENGVLIELFDGQNQLGQTTVVNGFWEITTSQITDGLKKLTITATDVAGNQSDASNTEFTIDSALPQINITNPQTNAVLNPGARLQGTVNGTGSTIDKLSYRFGNGSEINVPVNSQGAFDAELNLTGVTGQQNLIIKAIDLAGNSTETTQIVVVNLDNTPPQIPGFMLDTKFDSAPIGDSYTTFDKVNLIGQTEANVTVTLQGIGTSITADNAGKFTFTDVPLILGDNSFTVNAQDIAGNTSTFTTIIKRVAQDNSDVVLDWNGILLNAIYEDKTTPPVASRNMAITQTAVFDAINSITGTYKNYHFTGTAPTIVSAEAAAASAAHQVLINLYPGQKSYFDNALTASLAEITDGTAEDNGVTFGRTVADDILTFRSGDGSSNTITYTPGTNPGQWQPTSPGFASALLPQWGQVTPFALTSGDQFRPDGTPALNSADYTTEFNQVKDLGSKNSTTRTAEQTQIARFWADGSGTFTPPGHWNQIAQNVTAEKGNSLVDNARVFALLNISLADAGIAAWDAKYTYNFWRPITAIQNADSDGNANTIADATWTPLLTTPPFPEYISGHSTFSGAAETILTGLLGNNVNFTTNSLGTPGIYRTFSNFTNAANEAGVSRIYGGIHFNSANVEGLATGRSVGNFVLDNLLAPKLTVMPGQQLKLESKEIFGKNANFALESEQNLPTGNLDSDGTLIFKPSPSQIGSYDFTLVARDGEEVTSKKFNLAVVADTETTTRISGVIQNTDQKALAGVKVKIGDISTTTNADGSFILTVPLQGTALIIEPGQQVNNVVYPSIAEPLHLLLGHDVYANVKNIIDRPIYLPPIDISNAQTIDPTITQTVTSAAIPGSAVVVAANTLFDQQNQPYTGQLSITTVPTELTPAALPENLRPDLVVTIQPGEMEFTNPAPLSLPNLAGYAPGTEMDLWSINPVTGAFDDVGTGQVSADGTVINTISGGIRNSSWHFFAPPAPTPNDPDADDRNPDDGCDECKATAPGNSEVELHSGAVIETHDLVPYQSLGTNRGISLRYDSERADARPILHFGYNNVPNDSNLRLMAELTIKRGDFKLEVPGFAGGQFGLNGGEHFWSIPNGGGKIDAALQADLRTLDSGRYDYDLTTGLMRLNNNQLNGSTSTSKGKFLHINTVNSAFGSGWGLAGLQEIVVNADQSVIIIDGDGSELLFEKKADNSYDSPVGDFSTLERLNDGTFRRTMTDKTVYTFNGENLLTKVSDRIGNETKYIYENRRLTKMVDPVGLETTFTYSNSRIIEIKDPAGRSTKLTYDTNGNLIKITDPDGTSRTWEYNTDHLMISEVDKRGNKEQTFYDFAGRADRAIRKDGSELDFDPVQVQGLYAPNKTIDPVNAPLAFQLGNAASTYTDANGKKIVNILDQAGQIVSSSDEVGLLPAVQRNEDNLVTRQTDARGNITSFTYDDNGNVLSIQDSLSFSIANGGNVLIVNGASGSSEPQTTSDSTNNIKTLLQEAGFQTTVVDSLPTDLTGFSEIWDIRFTDSQPITTTESAQYLSFLQSGGELFAIGENSSFSNRNNSLLSFINQAGGGLLNFTVPNSTQQISGIFTTPNTIPDGNVTYANPGGVAGSGNGQFITFDASGNSSAVIFDEGDLANALTGKLVAVFDINFFQGIYDQPDSQNLVKNIVQLNPTSRRFTYDPSFNQLTSMTDELGHQTLYQIDPNNGNLLSLTQVVGAVGGNDDIITQFTYTNNGLVDLITDPLGRITDSDYDANGRLISIIYAKGTADEAKRQFEYDLAGNQTAIIDENGNRTTFEYDALNRLVKIIEADPDGAGPLTSPVTTYGYDARGNLISTTDAAGRVAQNAYDQLNRLIQSVDALNQKTNYGYDKLGNLLSVVDPLGHKTENKYDPRNRVIETIDPSGSSNRFSYDLDNNLASVVEVSTTKDNRNNALISTNNGQIGIINTLTGEFTKLASTSQNWTDIALSSDNKLFGITSTGLYQIDSNSGNVSLIGNLGTSNLNALGVAPNNELYATGGSNFYKIDSKTGTASLIANLGTNFSSSGDIVFDPVRSLLWATSNSGGTDTLFSITLSGTATKLGNTGFGGVYGLFLDEASNLLGFTSDGKQIAINKDTGVGTLQKTVSNLSSSILGSAQNITGNLTTFAYDARNRKTGQTDALGKTTQYQFDAANNLISQTDRNGNQTKYQYDDLNRRIQTQDALSRISSTSYNGVGNITSTTDELGRITKYTYDNRNRSKTIIDPLNGTTTFGYDLVGNLKTITDELNRTNSYNYDALNRKISTADPLGQTTRTVYDAVDNVILVTDALNQTTSYNYDALNRRTKVTDAKGQVTTTVYDAVGNILSITDPVGNKTSYTYDANNRLSSDTNALGKTASYQYDFAGNETATTDRNGRVRKFTYDQLNRQIGEQWLDANNISIRNISYIYDAVGNLTTASDPNSKYSYGYDVVNRLISVDNKDTAGVPNVLLNYTYDPADNLLKVTDTINNQLKGTTSYTYDALNRATSLTQSGNGVANKRVDMTYDAASQMTDLNRFTDLAGLNAVANTGYTYDANGRLTNLTHKQGNNNLAAYSYVYDAVNRITQTTSVDGTSTFSYDATNQLTSTDHSYQTDEAYSYDANGNRTNTGYTTGTNNQLLSDGTYNYEYDGEGNRTKRTEIATGKVTEYVWDYRNRLTKVSFKDAAGNEIKTVEYTYDVNNRRIAKSIDPDGAGAATPTVERYVYDGQNIALTFDGNGTQTHRYFYGTGVDQILADENGQGQVLWTLTDNQGTVRDLVDSTGTVQNHITYDSFGKITSQTNPVFKTIFAYTGREFDGETGQYYYRARYYDQNVGRFIGEDPIGFNAGDTNLYRYVANSPTNANDPSGLIIDTAADIVFIGYDIYKIVKENIFGNCDNLGENLLALGADVAGALTPFATGLGAGVRAAKAADRALEAARSAERAVEATKAAERAVETARASERAADAAKAADHGADTVKATKNADDVARSATRSDDGVREIVIDSNRHPEAAQHIRDAQANGHPQELTIDKGGTNQNRRDSLRGHDRVPGKDRDEYPPAVFKEGGSGSSVRPINPSDNRGAGASIGNQIKGLPDGTKVRIIVKP